MSWTTLKAAIAAAIKTNNNQEITGAVLQNTLNSIVNSVGANATFAGVATPSTSPGTPDGPVFWIAGQGGQYSNFGNQTITVGTAVIGIFVWNGSAWSYEPVIISGIATTVALNEAIQQEATARQQAINNTAFNTGQKVNQTSIATAAADFESNNPSDLAKVPTVGAMLGGANDGVYDISARHNGTKYADLSAALDSNNGGGVPQSLQKGGMSIKFVQSSNNKYVQWRLMAQNFTTDVTQWQGVDDEPTSKSDNLVKSGGVDRVINETEKQLFNISQRLLAGENTSKLTPSQVITSKVLSNDAQNRMFVTNVANDNYIINVYDLSQIEQKLSIVASANYFQGLFAFFTSDSFIADNFVGPFNKSTSGSVTPQMKEFYCSIPAGAAYLVVAEYKLGSGVSKDINPSDIIDGKKVAEFLGKEGKVDDIVYSNDRIYATTAVPSSTLTEKTLDNVGCIVNVASADYSVEIYDLQNVSGNLRITASKRYNNSFYSFFKDSNFTSQSSVLDYEGDAISEAHSKEFTDVIIPQNAAYLVVGKYASLACGVTKQVPVILNVNTDTGDIKEEMVLVMNPATIAQKAIWSTDGAIYDAGSESYYCLKVPVTPGETIHVVCGANWHNCLYAFYSDNELTSVIDKSEPAADQAQVTYYENNIVVPNDALYVVVACYQKSYPYRVCKAKKFVKNPCSSITGKKWVCVGDSLTDDKNSTTTRRYFDYVENETGVHPINFGKSGSGYARLKESNLAFYQRVQSIPTDADIVTIFGSFNDLGSGLSLGNVDDDDDTTIAGCINLTIDNIQSRIPLVRLGIVAPTPWDTTKPALSGQAYNYVKMLEDICKVRSIPFLNLWYGSNLRPWDADFRQAAYSNDGGSGTHPDENGHALIAPMFRQFILSLI